MAKVVINPVCADVTIGGVPFNALNLNLAKAVHDYLVQVIPDNQIIMTRTNSTVCPIDSTQAEAIANADDVQLVVSVGVDNADDTTAAGMEVFDSGSENSIPFANSMFAATADLRTKWNLNARFGGAAVLTTYFMLTKVTKPTILVMAGMMSNANDFNVLTNYNFQKDFGFAVAQAISTQLGLGTLQQNPITLPPTPTPVPSAKSYTPWIIGGIAGLGLVAILVLTGRRRK